MNKKLKRVVYIAVLPFLLSGCGGASGAAQPESVTYSPAEIDEVLTNPYMGWVPWASGTAHPQPFTMVYAPLLWRELEPVSRGYYDWAGFEKRNNFDFWSSRGVKIVIRFYLDQPTDKAHRDIPDWLHDILRADKGTVYSTPIGRGFSPNYGDPVLIAEHGRVIAALGARYAADSRVAFIELGSLGHWGEWHCWPYAPTDGGPSGAFPVLPVSDQYVQHYIDAFPVDRLLMRRGYRKAKDWQFGLYNDMFGDKASLDSPGWGWLWGINNGYSDDLGQTQPAMPEFWKHGPSGGEFANGDPQYYLTDHRIKETQQAARTSHTSWLGPSSPADMAAGCPEQANIDALMKTLGYRFVLVSETHPGFVAAGKPLTVTMNWQNKGVAPFYFRWPLELSLADPTGAIVARTITDADIRGWLPGTTTAVQSVAVPADLANGAYTLCVAILDPATGGPGISLAIGGKRQDGRYQLGVVRVVAQ